jgi:hypothetical protein
MVLKSWQHLGSNLTTFKGCTNPHIGGFTSIYYVALVARQKLDCKVDLGTFGFGLK